MADDSVREKRQRVEEGTGASDQGEEPDVKRARVEPPADPPLGPTFVPAGTHEAAAGPAETEQEESTSHSHFDDNPDEITGRVTCRVLIPSKAVGRVIGKGGEVADAIRSETGVRLVVDKSSVGVERLVTLQGGLRDVERAFERMWAIVQRKEAEDAEEDPYIALTPDRLALQFQTVKLVIPAARAGGIIGKKGEGIKQLRRETGAVVNVQSSRDLLQPTPDRIVTISGQPHALMEAVKLIVLRVAAMSSRQSEAAGRDQIGPHPMDGLVRAPPESSLLVVQLSIPGRYLGRIIGRGGQEISRIRVQSGCSISIQEKEDEDLPPGAILDHRILSVMGTVDNVQKVQSMVTARVAEAQIEEAQAAAQQRR